MALNKPIKQAFSTLQNQINELDYVLTTKTKIIFKNKVYIKADGIWVDDDNTEPSEVLSGLGLDKKEEINSIINENSDLKKRIEELNLKILQLEEGEEEQEEEEEEEDFVPKKKVSGKPASQNKVKTAIIKFFNDNKADGDLLENFSEFSVILDKNNEDRIKTLKKIFDGMKGGASEHVYKSFIELEILYQLYLKEFGRKKGSNLAKDELNNIIITKKKPSIYFKKASNFYFICKHLKKGGWKKCDLAPTYWESVTGPTWSSILNSLNLE
jgi:hypothetical protein